jgi:hypothetical protein
VHLAHLLSLIIRVKNAHVRAFSARQLVCDVLNAPRKGARAFATRVSLALLPFFLLRYK